MTHSNPYKLRIKPVAKTLLCLHDLDKNLPGVVFTNDPLNLALKTASNVPSVTHSKRYLNWFSNSIINLSNSWLLLHWRCRLRIVSLTARNCASTKLFVFEPLNNWSIQKHLTQHWMISNSSSKYMRQFLYFWVGDDESTKSLYAISYDSKSFA